MKVESRNWKFEIREGKLRSRSVASPDEFCANFKFPISIFSFQRSSNASSGAGLIGIIIMIVLMGLLGGSVIMLTTFSSMESLQTLNWGKAFFAAEAGVSAAKYQMTTNASWYTMPPWMGWIGNASFSNVITTNATTTVISSTGVLGDERWTSRWSPAGGEITRAIVVYKQGALDFPRYRTCSNLRRLSDELTANDVAASVNWQRIVASPLINEFILVTQNSSRRIYAQTYTNGTWGSLTYLNADGAAPDDAARGFDVTYESLSGRGMVVYSIGTSNPQYRVWTSDTWSAPSNINVDANGPIRWVRLISKPGTNEIMCLVRWSAGNNYSSAIIWNGVSWTNLITLETDCASEIAYETFDAAYSASTALVVYINGSSPTQRRSPKYRTYTNGGWSAENIMDVLPKEPRWIRVEYSPDGTLAYAGFLTITTQRRLRGAYWNGTSWGGYNTFSDVQLDTIAYRCFDIAWSSQDNTLMVVYSRNNQDAQSYLRATWGGSSNYGSLVSTSDGQWCVVKPDPFTSEFYYLAQDAPRNHVNFQRWTGMAWSPAWSLFPELEDNTQNNKYNFTDFAFRRDSASTNCWPFR